jgi:hypothetical protein
MKFASWLHRNLITAQSWRELRLAGKIASGPPAGRVRLDCGRLDPKSI